MDRPQQENGLLPRTKPVEIAVVDDQFEVRKLLRKCLEDEGHVVVEAADKSELMKLIHRRALGLITLDLSLANGADGLSFAREVRAMRNVPIIMITGRGEPLDRVKGLEQGADDYIVKPFHTREVALRVRNVLARYGLTPKKGAQSLRGDVGRIRFESFVFDTVRLVLRRLDDSVVDLTETELHLLALFLRNPGRILSRDDIWMMLRGNDWSPLDRAIDGHIARLRRKIEPPGDQPSIIRSVRGIGYVLTSDIS